LLKNHDQPGVIESQVPGLVLEGTIRAELASQGAMELRSSIKLKGGCPLQLVISLVGRDLDEGIWDGGWATSGQKPAEFPIRGKPL
jgi:hypothetical protein